MLKSHSDFDSEKRDILYRQVQPHLGPFSFNREVVDVFDDMIQRSVPFYGYIQDLLIQLTQRFYQPHTAIADLGCSTGTTLARLLQAIPNLGEHTDLIGMDYSRDMLEKAQHKIAALGMSPSKLSWVHHDLNIPPALPPACVVISNLTLQFTDIQNRPAVLKTIYEALVEGGAFLYIEKCQGETPDIESVMESVYYEFKRSQGYSELEIQQKKAALSTVLRPLPYSEHVRLLRQAGFAHVDSLFRWSHFCVFVAIKNTIPSKT